MASSTNGALGTVNPPKPASGSGVVLDDLGGDDDEDEDEEAGLTLNGGDLQGLCLRAVWG